ncbi:2-amino-4-hydroxy-6-hydroxymethyldihydropteridinediphosphokinase [Halpernia humi]|uniref:2-amino-4-hydroxy-6-hydroxymethyldihydropteridine pyrophosphokinase n=1 Tax=Halpernia humi TaxID=493375 RepID=A0A1H5X7J8_9FLAO|nr:2-amino-4-hydroxy-6-hydroxymethyldihydropteridine diphosphokinase [Halpernia humi]SEG07370.1 2-amino-4-hydroxy-6-hydroxymethyldihydropteridinediphosphokinase [Halpernia humi]
MSQHKVVLLLGSNLGKRKNNIENALNLIERTIGKIEKKTDILESMPIEYDSCNIFCNIAIIIGTPFSPLQLLLNIKKIEHKMGRIADSSETGVYTDRVIDIDIVGYDNLYFKSKKLEIPHGKHISEREFSAKLLSELKKKH